LALTRGLFAGIISALLVVVMAAPALAHAALLASTLRDGDVFVTGPTQATFTYSETVTLPRDAVRLFDRNARQVDGVEVVARDRDVRVTLPPLTDGAYLLSVKVIAVDGHVVSQPLRFRVGEASADDADMLALLSGTLERDPTQLLLTVLRAVTYVAALLALGFVLLARLIVPAHLRSRQARVIAVVAASGAVAALLSAVARTVWLYAPDTVLAVVASFTDAVTSGFYARALTLSALAVTALLPRLSAGMPLAALTVVAAHVFDGHQTSFGLRPVMLLADTVHLGAGSVWFGGVALLWWLWRQDASAVQRAATRFSSVALYAALLTFVSGAVMAGQILATPAALLTTRYGNTLAMKLLLVAAIAVLALRLRTQLRREPFAAATFRRQLRYDLGVFCAVLSVTAALVTTNPQGDTAAALVTQRGAFGPYTLDIALEPGTVGSNVLHAYVITPEGTLADTPGELLLAATLVGATGERVGPFVTELAWVSDGHFVAVTDIFTFSGVWELSFSAPLDRFTVLTETLVITLP